MASLGIAADHSKDGIARMVADLELLVEFCVAAAVENSLLCNFAHVTLLVLDVYCWTILSTKAAVVFPDAFVGCVLVVVEASDAPGTV